jgi:hypothetical protein
MLSGTSFATSGYHWRRRCSVRAVPEIFPKSCGSRDASNNIRLSRCRQCARKSSNPGFDRRRKPWWVLKSLGMFWELRNSLTHAGKPIGQILPGVQVGQSLLPRKLWRWGPRVKLSCSAWTIPGNSVLGRRDYVYQISQQSLNSGKAGVEGAFSSADGHVSGHLLWFAPDLRCTLSSAEYCYLHLTWTIRSVM